VRRSTLPVALALSLVAGACGTEVDAGARATTTPVGSIAWVDCEDGLACATVSVPIDRESPGGPSLELAVAVRAARAEDRIGVLLTNPGGPGASGVAALRSGLPLPDEVLDRFDVVSWDPRGVGQSTSIDCGPALPSLLSLDPRAEAEDRSDVDHLAPVVARSCEAGSGRLVDHLTTPDHVRDMDAIRVATGEATISYLGFSYGTRFGLEYLGRHPDRVASMVLDSIVRPDLELAELLSTQAVELEGVVDDLLGGDDSAFLEVRRDAADSALAGAAGRLDPVRVDRALVLAGYDALLAEQFLDGLADAADGDGRALDEQGRRYEQLVHFPAYLAISCADGRGPLDEAGWDGLERQVQPLAPLVGAVVVNELRPCAFWGASAVGPNLRTPVDSEAAAADVLLLNNIEDPATPVEWARSVAADLPSASLVEIDEPGHIALDGSACAREIAGRVLTGQAVPDDPECP
jgi:pimeloyl-ACP methyl ester carboxylesterase